jgi:alpha-D-xyloside xylohydrolase
MTGWDRKEVKSEGVNSEKLDWTTTKTAIKYLPKGTEWYDFWTGKQYKGGQNVTIETAFDRVPMFVRAGSIVPMGPEMQYVGEKSWDNLELRVYPGADGQFVLYEDEGDNYNYEKGAYSIIHIKWNERARTLTIEARQGTFKGMLQERRFTILTPEGKQQTITYDGKKQVISL